MALFDEHFYQHHVPGAKATLKWVGDQDIDYGAFAALVAFLLLISSLFIFGVSGGQILTVLFALTPIWLPFVLFTLFFTKWMEVIGLSFYLNQGRTTLRIRLPQEVFKSPEAMEFVIAQIHNTANSDNFMQTYLDGKRPLPFSFELVSIGGEVRFYVNLPTKKSKNAFETNIYAQYPGVEVIEEPVDYAAEIPLDYDKHGYEVFSAHMGKKKDGIFPIKTYIDFGLDKMPKEEEKVDPITPMLELLGSIQPHERVYIQIIAISFRVDSFQSGQLRTGEGDDWTVKLRKEVDKILMRDPKTKLYKPPEGKEVFGIPNITGAEMDTVKAMERQASKYAYNTAMRFIYANKKGGFNGDLMNPLIRVFSQYDMIGRNAIGVRWRTDFDYKNIIPGGKKKELRALKKRELQEYRMRVYAPKSGGDGYKIFTSEELATMWHLPGQVALTPTLDRVPSKRGEAPSNLPFGELPK